MTIFPNDGNRLVRAIREGNEGWIWLHLESLKPTRAWSNPFRAISPDEAQGLILRGDLPTRVALASHPNGRVREAALRALEPAGGATLQALLLRANDWVPIVASLAGQRAIQALAGASDEDLAESLSLVCDLAGQRRVDHRPLIESYRREVARRHGLARRLRKAFGSGPKGVWAFLNLRGNDESPQDVAREGLRNPQSRVQLAAARHMTDDPRNAPVLLASPHPQIRRIGLALASPEAREPLLTDLHAAVRNDARYFLGKRDYAAWYTVRLPEPGAVSGLGEVGSRTDAEPLRPLLAHPDSKVRTRALESWARLLEIDAEPELRAALRDPSRKVQHAATNAVMPLPIAFDPSEILALDLSARFAWLLMEKMPRWSALVAVAAHLDSFPQSDAWIWRWVRTARFRPTVPRPEQASEWASMLQSISPNLEPELAAALREVSWPWVK